MDKLPRELLLQIVDCLPRRDLQQLALSNQQWCDWIRKNGFFEKVSLDIVDEYRILPEHCLPFFKKTTYGSQVKHLAIRGVLITPPILQDITESFPNTERLAWDLPDNYMHMFSDEIKMIIKSWKRLKRIDGDGSSAFTKIVLSSRCNAAQLETIRLGYIEEGCRVFQKDLLYLKHARKLQSLTLERTSIDRQVLEQIHSAAPDLKKLKLYCLHGSERHFFYKGINLHGKAIKKMGNLDSLCITAELRLFDSQSYGPEMMDFISKAYADIASFKFRFNDRFKVGKKSNSDEGFNVTLCRALSKWHNLKTFDFQLYPLDSNILQAMDASGIKLEKLTIHVDRSHPSWMDQYICLISYSDVVRNLKKLHLFEERYNEHSEEALLGLLGILPRLETLIIKTRHAATSNNGPIYLTSILNTAPQLRHLQVQEIDIQWPLCNKLPSISQSTQLVDLTISDIWLCPTRKARQALNGMFEDILSHCPLLEKLTTNINADTKASRDTSPVIFNFEKLLRMQEVRITSLYKTDFKVTVDGRIDVYHKTSISTGRMSVRDYHTPICISIIANRGVSIITNASY